MLRLSLISLILAFSASANADDFDYNFLTLGYGTVDFDDLGVDGNGFTIGGSYAMTDSYYAFFNYNAASLDADIDTTLWGAGFGYHRALSDQVDLVAELSYEYVEFDIPLNPSIDDTGLGLAIGVRFAQSEKLELNAGINYVDYSDGGDDTGFELGALYSINDAYSVGLSGEWSDNISMYTLSGRFHFGK
jgi:hypothetical protein